MKSKFLAAIFIISLPLLCSAQKREIVEMQRDISQLQDQIRALQTTLNEKTAALTVLVQQSLDAANKNSNSVAVLERALTDQLTRQGKDLTSPIAVLGTKMDQLSGDVQGMKESINDLNNRMNKLQAQVADVKTLMSSAPSGPAPAPATGSPSGPPPMSSATPSPISTTPPKGMSAENLYANALRDKNSGQLDQAQQEFTDYLQYFGNTDYAPNCQFYLGEIAYNKGDFDGAIKAFDLVVERYSENNKTPDARYMKGKALLRQNQRSAAVQEFREIIRKYPNKDVASKARTELKTLGLTASTASAPAPGRAGARRRR